MQEGDYTFKIDILFGHVEIDSWMEFRDGKMIGMGSKQEFDRYGVPKGPKVIEPTGLVMVWE